MAANLTPRLPTSTTWTNLPSEFSAKIKTIFENQFKVEAGYGEFMVDGRIYPDEVVIRIGFLEEGRLKQINFEASIDLPKVDAEDENSAGGYGLDGMDRVSSTSAFRMENDGPVLTSQSRTMNRIYVCIDALGSSLEEYFEEGDEDRGTDIPLFWNKYDFENDEVYMKSSTVNTRLEEEADRLLGLLADSLLNEEASTEDALAKAEIDSELARDVQEAIRSGKYEMPSGFAMDDLADPHSVDGESSAEHGH